MSYAAGMGIKEVPGGKAELVPVKQKPSSHVMSKLHELNHRLNDLENRFEELSYMCTSQQEPPCNTNSPCAELPELFSAYRDIVDQCDATISRIFRIFDRIDR